MPAASAFDSVRSRSIAGRAKIGAKPAIDSTAFPGTPSNWYWSSSPYVGNSGSAWGVNFNGGHVDGSTRGSSNRVRLVRASQ